MKYACLIYSDENDPTQNPDPTSEAMAPIMAGYFAFGEEFSAQIQGGEALAPTDTATCVRVKDGDITTTDGPFAETKEHLGGFYVVEADDLDAAVRIAARIPHAALGVIEVRPVLDFG